jgi:hypothetical protein
MGFTKKKKKKKNTAVSSHDAPMLINSNPAPSRELPRLHDGSNSIQVMGLTLAPRIKYADEGDDVCKC